LGILKLNNIKEIAIIGGGFFGMYIAEYLALKGCKVTIFEKENDFMTHASYHNQARVHNGYHYPRSILTALRSRVSFPRFVDEFGECVYSDFEKYYLIAKPLSKVSLQQFELFCDRIGASIGSVPTRIKKLFNTQYVEGGMSVQEYAFDAIKLKKIMEARLEQVNVEVQLNTRVISLQEQSGKLLLSIQHEELITQRNFDHVFNCTYSQINSVLTSSSLDMIPLKHEMTEMCLVSMPDELKKVGVTVMCGPFFSVMPFPSTPFHSFSHVRYTPHYEWHDSNINEYCDAHEKLQNNTHTSAWNYMIKDAVRYMPILSECKYEKSLWEVKTILPRSEVDDSRPILLKLNHGYNNFHSIMGGKIDNVYDVVEVLKNMFH